MERYYYITGTEFLFGKRKKFWKIVVIIAQQCECIYCHCTVYLKMVKIVKFMLYIFYHNFLKKEI